MSHKITYGNRTFEDRDIISGECHLANDLMSASLEMNTLDFEVESNDTSLLAFTRNAPLTYYNDGRQVGIFFVQKIKRTAKTQYSFTCTSAMGLLDETDHYGGIYTGQTVAEVVADICGSTPHYVKTNLQNIKLYGYLPIATRRENLSQVLFAIGATVKSDMNGYLRIEGLWGGISNVINEDRAYSGGSVESDTPVTRVVVTEHQYLRGTEIKKLYEGATSEGDIVTFDEPSHDLSADGFRILESGPNYAKLSSGNGTLTGTPYIHSTREVSKAVNAAQAENVVRVEDATLVSLANANAVADRLARYYACREVVEQDIVYASEVPGNVANVAHPYGGMVQSCIESMDITLSGVLRSAERHLIGFVPPEIGQAEYYDNAVVITKDSSFVVPEGVTSIRIVLIGGGDGGHSGCDGESGSTGNGPSYHNTSRVTDHTTTESGYGYGEGGEGGDPGDAGPGGKVFQTELIVQAGQVFQAAIGHGGAGARRSAGENVAGAEGTPSRFGGLTSDRGASSSIGFTDPFTGNTYAAVGRTGINGGKGNSGTGKSSSTAAELDEIVISDPVTDYDGNKFYPGENNTGTSRREAMIGSATGPAGTVWGIANAYSHCGLGGGAAVGNNGETRIGVGNANAYKSGNALFATAKGGPGANGANAISPSKQTLYGKGGNGGHGGGGGGTGGWGVISQTTPNNTYVSPSFSLNASSGDPGAGGSGSDGGDGGDGCVIVYYRVFAPLSSGRAIEREGRERFDKYGRRVVV
ncbi:hypothetical protein RWV98_17555 [Agathobaculum sp. NTUH-O15-33]|uniref:hypothetical protein n=1 Tax=Agathobaculum sp. NTUH-O15-33 TaxID=3079302 RepID=UPI00295885CF|nr:hypothetical protein [Agathobaculum sp. NTUH-O15-33]WNX84358.1 hypothetical protein RWV98_17555 [Agathobaculum sp. NTUH-O15-33]